MLLAQQFKVVRAGGLCNSLDLSLITSGWLLQLQPSGLGRKEEKGGTEKDCVISCSRASPQTLLTAFAYVCESLGTQAPQRYRMKGRVDGG